MAVHKSDFYEFPDLDSLITSLEQIRPKIDANDNRLRATLATNNTDDARYTAFSHLVQVVDSTGL